MDPDQTFIRFINAVCDRDLTTAREAIDDLRSWVQNGGFSPTFPASANVAAEDKIRVPTSFLVWMSAMLRRADGESVVRISEEKRIAILEKLSKT